MEKLKELLMELAYLLAIISGVAIAEISISTRNPIPTYVWCGFILPAFLFLATVYLVKKGHLPKDLWKVWAVIVCGLLLMGFSGIITLTQPNIGIILLLSGFLLIIFTGLIFRSRKVLEARTPETPKSFLKSCVKCGKEIPIASEQCPFCGQTQNNSAKR
ncbi:MAG: hypothetical protein ACPLW8_03370 [Candidatus Bathyarchaeales archaeon]